jgi:hypothetical protein
LDNILRKAHIIPILGVGFDPGRITFFPPDRVSFSLKASKADAYIVTFTSAGSVPSALYRT